MPSSDGEPCSARLTSKPFSSSSPSISLSRDHITQALATSPDNGATLDLAHKGITDVGESGAEVLATMCREVDMDHECTLVRIALAYNRLTTLPMAFALLSGLRYLVLKHNNFTVFPDVLTVMPSLEILDISRNKIKRLPTQPGSLTKLRVFSLIRNRIHKLPTYITQFDQLSIFKVDQNPIEWPPKHVLDFTGDSDDPQIMTVWIRSLQGWMSEHAGERKLSDDSIIEYPSLEMDADLTLDEGLDSSSYLPTDHYSDVLSSHSRSFSLDSQASNYSEMSQFASTSEAGPSRPPQWPPHLQLDHLDPPIRTSNSPPHSPESYLPTPEESISSTDEDSTNSTRKGQQQHGRNASYAGGGHKHSRSTAAIKSKKSLPELRPVKPTIASQKDGFNVFHDGGTPDSVGPSKFTAHFAMPSPPVNRQDSDSSHGSLLNFRNPRLFAQEITASPVDRPAPPMDVERNSYFRRLSTLTAASKTIPPALLSLVDAVRGILFAVSQIYQTLRHYTVDAIDERLSAVLVKVLDPASIYMTQLINALDRFDTMSRRTLPPPSVCRAVVESCRDAVTVFGKAVGMLGLQLKVLATHDDARYTRQMLLVLYGAMAEISNAWETMASHINAVKPLLREHRPPPVAKIYPSQSTIRPMPSMDSTRAIPTSSATAPLSATSLLPQPRVLLRSNSGGDGKARMRRHAGSFSSKDVEIGKNLPSYVEMPNLPPGFITSTPAQTPTMRAARRPGAVASASPSGGPLTSSHDGLQNTPSTIPAYRGDSHLRQDSQSSQLGPSISSPSLAFKVPLELLDTNTLVDKETIGTMKLAIDAAPAIWDMMDEMLVEMLAEGEIEEDLRESLDRAKEVTGRLRDNILAMQEGREFADRKTFRDDAHIFVKNVIALSSAVKSHGSAHPLSSTLRTNMVKLMNATQEFVMLLHISSFSPAVTPRPYSPMVGSAVGQPSLLPVDDSRLGPNLSRNRSIRSITPIAASKLTLRDPPRSALPHHNFKIHTPPRFGAI